MKEAEKFKHFCQLAGVLLLFTIMTSCEKNKYDLLDPSSTGKWTLFNTTTGLPGNFVGDIIRDGNNDLWFTFFGYGAAKYSNGTWTTYNKANSSILNNNVTCVTCTTAGTLIFGTNDGISIRSASGQWSSYKDPLATTMFINTVKIASNGWLWIGTQGQGFYVNDMTGSGYQKVKWTGFENVNKIEEGKYNETTKFREIWLGTDNGLIKYDYSAFTLKTTSDGLPYNDITALYYDSKARLWIGTNGGQKVAWMDDSGVMRQLALMNGNVGTFVRDIHEDRKGAIWFATWLDGLICFDGVLPHSYKEYNGFYDNNINTIGDDKDGNLWFGLYYHGLVKYSLPLY